MNTFHIIKYNLVEISSQKNSGFEPTTFLLVYSRSYQSFMEIFKLTMTLHFNQ